MMMRLTLAASAAVMIGATTVAAEGHLPTTEMQMKNKAAELAVTGTQLEASMEGFIRLHKFPTPDADCAKMSTAFKTTCDKHTCAPGWIDDCDKDNFDPANALCMSKLCCHYDWDAGYLNGVQIGSILTPQTCDKTDHKVKLLYAGYDQNWDGDHGCCNTCSEGFNGPASGRDTNAFKAECIGQSFQGPAICGTTADGTEQADPSTYFLGCATGPQHTLTGIEDDDCEVGKEGATFCPPPTCAFTPEGLHEFLDAELTSEADFGLLSKAGQQASRMFEKARAFVTNGPDVVNKAVIELGVKSTGDAVVQRCAEVLLEPNMGAGTTLDATSGFAYVSNPTVNSAAEIKVSGAADFTVFGGSNAGKITMTDVTPLVGGTGRRTPSGSVQIAGTTNSGPITATRVKGLFIADVENKAGGDIVAVDTEASLYNVVNHADVTVTGGKFNAYNMENHGTVTITGAEVNGAMYVNTGTVKLIDCTGSFGGPVGGGTGEGSVTVSGDESKLVATELTPTQPPGEGDAATAAAASAFAVVASVLTTFW